MGGSKAVRVVKLRADEADVRPWAEAAFGPAGRVGCRAGRAAARVVVHAGDVAGAPTRE